MEVSRKVKDLSGMVFERLTVVKLDHLEKKQKNCAYWECICVCNKTKIVKGTLLINGNTRSCGCLQKENASEIVKKEIIRRTLPCGVSACNDLYRQYKKRAKNKNFNFDISYEYFVELTSQNCSYCGSAPSNLRVSRSGNCSYLYNGIDRVSNDKGYVTGNCAPCCKRCNAAKSDLSENDFLILVKDIFYNKKLNHLPVNDAKGNAEVLLQMHKMGLNIPIK